MDFDLTTPETAADELGLAAADAKLTRAISAASAAISRYIGRRLHYSESFVESLPGCVGRVRLLLGLVPVRDIATVELPDIGVVTDWRLEDKDLGFLYRTAGWPFTGLVRSGLLYDAPAVGTELASIIVTYSGGWVTPAQAAAEGWSGPERDLPFDLEEACLQAVAGIYRGAGVDKSIASESLGDYSVAYRTAPSLAGILPDTVLAQLDAYKVLV